MSFVTLENYQNICGKVLPKGFHTLRFKTSYSYPNSFVILDTKGGTLVFNPNMPQLNNFNALFFSAAGVIKEEKFIILVIDLHDPSSL